MESTHSRTLSPAAGLSLRPIALAVLFGAGVLVGGVSGAVATAELGISLRGPVGPAAAVPAPAPVFDAVAFRAGERSLAAPVFDAVAFRAEERAYGSNP